MDIYTKTGSKIVLAFYDKGMESDIKNAKKYLKLNDVYTLDKTEVYEDITFIYLSEFPGIRFNSLQFENIQN